MSSLRLKPQEEPRICDCHKISSTLAIAREEQASACNAWWVGSYRQEGNWLQIHVSRDKCYASRTSTTRTRNTITVGRGTQVQITHQHNTSFLQIQTAADVHRE